MTDGENQALEPACAPERYPLVRSDFPPALGADYWLDVLDNAVRHGLVDQAEVEHIRVRAALGMLPADGVRLEAIRLLAKGQGPERSLRTTALAFNAGDVTQLGALAPNGGGAWSICGRLHVPQERATLRKFVSQHIGLNNLYFGINPRKPEMAGTTRAGSALDVMARRIVVLDLDLKDAPRGFVDPDWTNTRRALRTLDPILELDSGNGFHFWFRIGDLEGSELTASVGMLASAMSRLGADNMADLPRISRLPYTVNIPTKTKRERGAIVRLVVPVSE